MKNTMFKRVFSICLVSAVLASTGSAVFSAQAIEEENTTASAVVSAEENTADTEESSGVYPEGLSDDELLQWEREYFADYGKGAVSDENEETDPEHIISSVEEYNEFAGIEENPKNSASLPDECDNSTNENARFFPPIGDQGLLSSCCAWATTYYQFTYMTNKARGVSADSDHIYSPTWIYNLNNDAVDKGVNATNVYNSIKQQGVALTKDVPIATNASVASNYRDLYARGDIWANALANRLTDFAYINAEGTYTPVSTSGTPVTDAKDSDLDELKTAINNGDILCFVTFVKSWDLKTIKQSSVNGVDNRFVGQTATSACTGSNGCHEMTIVGYNDNIWIDINNNDKVDAGEMGAFKIANSWGKTYRNNGFTWVAYDALNEVSSVSGIYSGSARRCIFQDVASITVENKNYAPKNMLKCVLNSAVRYESLINVRAVNKATGISAGSTDIQVFDTYSYNLPSNNITSVMNVNYEGKTGKACDGTFYFDLERIFHQPFRNYYPTIEDVNDYNWEFCFSDRVNDYSIFNVKEVKIVDYESRAECDIKGDQTISLNNDSAYVYANSIEYPFEASIEVTPQMNFGLYEYANIKATACGGKAPYQYKFECSKDGQTTLLSDFSSSSTLRKQFPNMGYYMIYATVRDAEGREQRVGQRLAVNQTYILGLNPDQETGKVGQKVTFTPNTHNLASVMTPDCFRYTVTKDGVSTSYSANSAKALEWVPQEEGEYTVKCDLVYDNKTIYTISVKYTVEDVPVDVTIYYNGFDHPNIHYRAAGGSWTNVPGVAMEQSTAVSGYPYAYTIALNGADHAEVCFNDGNNNWDSRNGQNYIFTPGYYTFNNGTINEIEKPALSAALSLPSHDLLSRDSMEVSCQACGGTAPYTYKFTRRVAGNSTTETVLQDYSSDNTATVTNTANYSIEYCAYTITAYVKDAKGKVFTVSDDVNFKYVYTYLTPDKTTANVGENVKFTISMNGTYFKPHYFTCTVSKGSEYLGALAVNSDNTINWTAPESGTYRFTVNAINSADNSYIDGTYLDYTVNAPKVKSVNSSVYRVPVGQSIQFTAETENVSDSMELSYTIRQAYSGNFVASLPGDNATWIPDTKGTYSATAEVKYNGKILAMNSMTFIVDEAPKNEVTIYYNGYATPNIHYQVGNGSWTNVPGVAMTPTNEVAGYTHKYTIDLGSASYANVCFNDGNNNWDSNNGANYRFTKGTYTFSNGTITAM